MPSPKIISIIPFEFIEIAEDQNLTRVGWNQRFLERENKKYKLKHRQAVIYRNVARTKIRIVANLYNMPILILPPIDPISKISLYIKINEFLHKFSLDTELQANIETEISQAYERLQKSQQRKKLAQSAQKKRKFG